MKRRNYGILLDACLNASTLLLKGNELATSIDKSLEMIKNSLFLII